MMVQDPAEEVEAVLDRSIRVLHLISNNNRLDSAEVGTS